MLTIVKYYKYSFIFCVIFIALSFLYISGIKNTHQVTTIIEISRLSIENPEYPQPEVRNRWVWLRDGLSYKSFLESDIFLKKLLHENNQKGLSVDKLRNNINVDYSGPDDNLYTIKVKDNELKKAIKLSQQIIFLFKQHLQTRQELLYTQVINKLQERTQKEIKPNELTYLTSLIFRFKAARDTQEILASNRFNIIKNPNSNPEVTWPKKPFIILSFSLLGITLGLIIQFMGSILKNKKNT